MGYESYNEEKKFFAQDYEELMKFISAIGNVIAGSDIEDSISFIKKSGCIKQFLESPINALEEVNLKKIFAAALIIAKEKGVLPFELPESTEEIAGLVDEGLTRVKLAFKQQEGEMDYYEVVDALIDKAVSRTIAIADIVVEEGLPIVADKLSDLALIHPYTAPLALFIKIVVPYVAEPVKNAICKGIRYIANESKPIVHKAIDYVKVKTSSIAENITRKWNPILLS